MSEATVAELRPKEQACRVWLSGTEQIEFRFRDVGSKRFEELVCEFPSMNPDSPFPWDAELFPAALLAESCVEPKLVRPAATEIWDGWEASAAHDLFFAALRACRAPGLVDLYKERIFRDSRFREEMTFCVETGLPHSKFLSWSPDDQDKALATQRARAECCPTCGTREAEWKDDHFAYVSDLKLCEGCEALEQERERIPADENGQPRPGYKVFLVRNVPGAETSDWAID